VPTVIGFSARLRDVLIEKRDAYREELKTASKTCTATALREFTLSKAPHFYKCVLLKVTLGKQ